MSTRTLIAVAGVTAALGLSGCVKIPKDAGFTGVRQTVAERTGYPIQWDRGNQPDRQAAAATQALIHRELTLDAAVRVCLMNNQSLQATYEELGIAQAEWIEAGLLKNPTLGASFRFPRYHAFPFDFDITQSFLDLLVLPLRKRVAGAAFDAAQLKVTTEVLATVANLKASFYRAQGAAQLVEMRRQVVAATEASFEASQRLHEAGNASDLSLANERALHEQSKIELAKAERESLDSREELGALMGLWGDDSDWTMPARLPGLPAAEINATELESLALTQRTDLATARKETEVAAGNLALTRKSRFGSDVTIGAGVTREADAAITAGPSIELPLPLFNQGQPAVSAAEARLRQSERRYAAMAVQIRAEARRARNNLLAARDLADSYARVVVPLRHEIVRQNLLQLNAMQTTVFELLLAKQAEIDAGREYVEALKNYWVARTELERAVGGRLPVAAPPATRPSSGPSEPAGPPTPATVPAAPHHHHHGD